MITIEAAEETASNGVEDVSDPEDDEKQKRIKRVFDKPDKNIR